jgi:hypothetical protein
MVGDPLFLNIEEHNFEIPENSPAIRLGFKQIDTRQIGLSAKWRERLIGSQLLRTHIRQHEAKAETGGVSITITCDSPGAVIRFTTDGTEPTAASRVYKVPLEFDKPFFIRAKSFKPLHNDLYGAAEIVYTPE